MPTNKQFLGQDKAARSEPGTDLPRVHTELILGTGKLERRTMHRTNIYFAGIRSSSSVLSILIVGVYVPSSFATDAVVVLGAIIPRPKQASCSHHIGATTPPSRGAGYNGAHPAPARSRSTRYEQGRGDTPGISIRHGFVR